MMFLEVNCFDYEKVACKLPDIDVDQLDAVLHLFYRSETFSMLSLLFGKPT